MTAAGRLAAGCLVLAAAACTPLPSTPEQDLAGRRWAECRTVVPTADLLGVDPNGRIRFQTLTGFDSRQLRSCLAAAPPSGPVLPEPVGVGRPGAP